MKRETYEDIMNHLITARQKANDQSATGEIMIGDLDNVITDIHDDYDSFT